jgi:hypothetical protein
MVWRALVVEAELLSSDRHQVTSGGMESRARARMSKEGGSEVFSGMTKASSCGVGIELKRPPDSGKV